MATIMRARFTYGLGPTGSSAALFQTYWRPGTTPGSTADATDILARVRACLFSCVTCFGPDTIFRAVSQVDALEDSTGELTGSWTGAVPAIVTGTSSGDNLPAQTAYLIKATTALVVGPRLLKGRSYLGGAMESNSGPGGVPLSANVSTINTAFNGLISGGATLSFPVVWHRPNPAAAVPAGTSFAINGFQCEPDYWGNQRNRRF